MSATGQTGQAQQGNGSHYEGAPGAKKGRALATWEDFQGELTNREQEIATMLPKHVDPKRFKAVAIAAVKQNLDLLTATPRTLFAAITKAAQDGLLPDGREGVITIYNTNVAPKGQKAIWEKHAQWNPMIAGLRKRARELDGLIIDAQVVHENDTFVWHQGDEPRIEHEPARLGKSRGEMIGAYAIYKREDGTVVHREVMDKDQIEKTREQSKAKDSLMWTSFKSEGYRKSVARRGFKSVPVGAALDQIVRRDDDLFDFNNERTVEGHALVPPSPPSPPSPPKAVEHKPQDDVRKVIGEEIDRAKDETETIRLSEEEERTLDRQMERDRFGDDGRDGDEPPPADGIPDIPPSLRRTAPPAPPPESPKTHKAPPAPVDEMADWVADQVKDAAKAKALPELEALDDEVCQQLAEANREDLRSVWNEAYLPKKDELRGKKKK
jgi:recombination protein RecT